MFVRFSRLIAVLTVLVLANSARAQDAKKPISFINDVAPIFKEACFACHDAKKRSGKYDMTTFEKLMSEDRIVPGKPDESEVYELIVSTAERRMPPKKDNLAPLPKAQAEIVKAWIAQGAKLDQGIDPKADLVRELRVRWKPPTPPAKYSAPAIVNALAYTPDGKQLVVGGHQELTIWNVDTGKLAKRLHTRSERAHAMSFLPDGKLVVAGGRPGQEGDVRIYDLNGPAKDQNGVAILDGVNDPKTLVKHIFDTDDSVMCLAVSIDGKKIAAGGCDRTVRVWDLSEGIDKPKLTHTIENHADMVLGVAFGPEAKLLFSCSRDKTAKVWDLVAKESQVTFPEHQNAVWGVASKPDGKAAYSVGADKQLRLWNAGGEGKQIKVLGGHGDDILKLVAHPTLPLLATASADKTIKVWDSKTDTTTKTLQGMTDHVFAVAISPDGTTIAGGSYDGSVKIWKVADGTVVKAWNASPGMEGK